MKKVIVYKQEDGSAVVLLPAPEALALFGIDAIAHKDVPEGVPYGIINDSDVQDSDTWVIPDELLTDGVGASWGVFGTLE